MRVPRIPALASLERRLEQPWTFFGLTALTVLMVAIDSTIVAVALPTLVRDLDTSLILAAWTITAYALAQTVMLPMAGKLDEQFGQMRIFVVCVSLFTTGSLLCALAPNIYLLIACRIVQAIGGDRTGGPEVPTDAQPHDRAVRLDLPDRRHPRPESGRLRHRAFRLAADVH